MKFKTLYKLSTVGKVVEWTMEVNGDQYRTVSGQVDGQKVTSAWKKAYAKNVGRANATTAEEQAIAEAQSAVTKKKDKGYTEQVTAVHKPTFFKVMLATSYKNRKNKIPADIYSQPKLDGIRCVVTHEGMSAGRSGKPIKSAPHIYETLKRFLQSNQNLVLDGELYADSLSDNFEKIVSLAKKSKPTEADLAESAEHLQYWIYDIYDRDNKEMTFSERLKLMGTLQVMFITQMYTVNDKHIKFVPTEAVNSQDQLDKLYAEYLADGQEGQMIRLNAPYKHSRSNDLIKRKEFEDAEFAIQEVIEGQGNWAGYAKSIRFKLEGGQEFQAGIAGDQNYCRQLLERADELIGKEATVRYQNITVAGIPRFPIVKVIHETKRW